MNKYNYHVNLCDILDRYNFSLDNKITFKYNNVEKFMIYEQTLYEIIADDNVNDYENIIINIINGLYDNYNNDDKFNDIYNEIIKDDEYNNHNNLGEYFYFIKNRIIFNGVDIFEKICKYINIELQEYIEKCLIEFYDGYIENIQKYDIIKKHIRKDKIEKIFNN